MGTAMNKDRFLTPRWNHILALELGVLLLVFVIVMLSTSVFPIRTGFIAFAILGAVY
jgi:hypothetical protein